MRAAYYHSIYDDFYYYTHFSDTNFVYGRALAQTAGTAVLRMADAELLPYQYTAVAETIAGYVKELKTQLSKTQDDHQGTESGARRGGFSGHLRS